MAQTLISASLFMLCQVVKDGPVVPQYKFMIK